MASQKAIKTRSSATKTKQQNEIPKSKQLLQKKLRRHFSEESQISLSHEQKSELGTPLTSISQIKAVGGSVGGSKSSSTPSNYMSRERRNIKPKNLPHTVTGNIIILEDDDDDINHESELNKSTMYNTASCLIKCEIPQEFCPIPSTSTDDKIIFQNEQRFQEYVEGNCLKRKVTDNQGIIENTSPMITEAIENQECHKIKLETEVEDTNRPIISNTTNIIETIDLSNVDIDNVIAENELMLSRIQNKRQKRTGNTIIVMKSESTETVIIDDANNSNTVTPTEIIAEIVPSQTQNVSNKNRTTKVQSDFLIPPARHDHLQFGHQNTDTSQVISLTDSEESLMPSVEHKAEQAREVELVLSNNHNRVISPSVIVPESMTQLPIINLTNSHSIEIIEISTPLQNKSLSFAVDLTGDSINHSSSQRINSSQNLSPNDNQKNTCNCSKKANHNSPHQTSNTVPDNDSLNQSSEQNVSAVGKPKLCPICMEDLAQKINACTLCGHVFCMPCIKAALKYPPRKCPICRKKITGIGYHPIFW